ncbi:MAG: hypothetical protein AAF685_09850 [Cyanobacteria bacterium P01_C01_bin.89]
MPPETALPDGLPENIPTDLITYGPTLDASTILVIITTLLGVGFGLVFKNRLEFQVGQWDQNRETQETVNYKTPIIKFTYFAMTFFTFIAVGESLTVLGFFDTLAYGTAAVAVIPTAIWIWFQIGSMLQLMVAGGSAAIDIDEMG